jgi:SET domain-containing protein
MDLHKRWEHRWLTTKAKSFSSPQHGLGIIATEDINIGEDILVYGGIIISKSEIEEYWKIMGHVGTQIDDNFFIVPTSREELEARGTINHSCEPSIGFKNQIQLHAIKDIKSGEELFLDYAFCESLYPNTFECNCGSQVCRKVITKDDWKIKELQEKYVNSFSPYLRDKFRK